IPRRPQFPSHSRVREVFGYEQCHLPRTDLVPAPVPCQASKPMDSTHAQDAHRVATSAIARRILLRGYFTAPVTVEAAELAGDTTVFVRVRTASGGLDEVPVTIIDLQPALQDQSSTPAAIVAPDDLFLLIEAARILLA